MLKPLFTSLALLCATPALAETPRVATDIAPIHGLVTRVMDGLGAPDLIVPHGRSPHDHTMRPSEATALNNADVVIWIGETLTPWMPRTLATLAPDAVSVALIETEGTHRLPFREGVGFEPHDHDHGHDHGQSHDYDDHDKTDPHAWLDPDNAIHWLDVIATQLAKADPANAAAYTQNAEKAQAEIAAAVAEAETLLADARNKPAIVFHDAYQYFEDRFGLSVVASISLADGASPSAARIAEVQSIIAERNVACVFAEPQFNPKLVETVTDGTAASTATIDPMGSNIALGPDFYPALILAAARAMASCG